MPPRPLALRLWLPTLALNGHGPPVFRPQEKAFVTTKCTLQPYTEEKIRDACAYSMEKLQTDCIELYQLHGWDPNTPIADQV